MLVAFSACGGEADESSSAGADPQGTDSVASVTDSDPATSVNDSDPAITRSADERAVAAAERIDPEITPAIAGEGGWDYFRETFADLNGDGEIERVVMTVQVEMYRGRPAWDDGQPWQVYIESEDEARTYVYAQRLQLGSLTMRLSRPDEGDRPTIVLIEHLPERLRIMEAWYPSTADSLSIVMRLERNMDARGDTASPELP